MVEFLGQHPNVLDSLVLPPHNLFATLATLTMKLACVYSRPHLIPQSSATAQSVALTVLAIKRAATLPPKKKEEVYIYFVSQYLRTGAILAAIGIENTMALAKALSSLCLVNAIVQISSTDSLAPLSHIWLIGHFLLLISLSGKKAQYLTQSNYVKAIAQLLRKSTKIPGFVSMKWSTIGMASEEDEEEEEDENELEGEDVVMTESLLQKDISSFAAFDDRMRALVERLATRQQIASIVSSASRENAAEVANCLIAILQAFPTKRDAILMDLILIITTDNQEERKDIIGVLWARVQQGELFKVARNRKIELSQLQDLDYDADWPALVLLVYLYSRLLLTMIDDEFFDPSKSVINLDDVRVLSKFLCHIVFSMWWSDKRFDQAKSMGDTGVTFKQFRSIATQCIIKIYLRDSRKPFLPEGHWLMMSESADTFISAVNAEEEEKDEDNGYAMPSRRGIHAETRLYKRVVGKANFTTPRLNILRNVPFFIPFETRVEIFRGFIDRDRDRNTSNRPLFMDLDANPQTPIHRDKILEDAFENLGGMARKSWKSPFHIQLVDQFGLPEAGIDGGGLTKEFLTAVCKEAFDPEMDLFMETPDRLLYPSTKDAVQNLRPLYDFLGHIVGKCLYENVLVDVEFAPFFLLRWFGRHAYLDDLPSLDKQLYNSLVFLKQYQGNYKDLALYFTKPVPEGSDVTDHDLIPNGRNIPVTYQNRLEYIQLVANYRLNASMYKQTSAFVRGLSDLIDVKWLVMFNQKELQTLVGGAEGKPIDVDELKRFTVLGGYADQDLTVKMFWEVMREMQEVDKRKVLKFVTSVERPPLLGFNELSPKFSIRRAGTDDTRVQHAEVAWLTWVVADGIDVC